MRRRGWLAAAAGVGLVEAYWLWTGGFLGRPGVERIGTAVLHGPHWPAVAAAIAALASAACLGVLAGLVTPRLEADIAGALEVAVFAGWLSLWPMRQPGAGTLIGACVSQGAVALECVRLARGPLGLDDRAAAGLGWLAGVAWLVYSLPLFAPSRPTLAPNVWIALNASGSGARVFAFLAVIAVTTLGHAGWTRLWPSSGEGARHPLAPARPGPRSSWHTLRLPVATVLGLALIVRVAPLIAGSSFIDLAQFLVLLPEAVAAAAVGGAAGWLFGGAVWPIGALPQAYRWVPVAAAAGWMASANTFLVARADRIMNLYWVHFPAARWVDAVPACFAAALLARLLFGLTLPRSLAMALLAAWGVVTLTVWDGFFHPDGPVYTTVTLVTVVAIAAGLGACAAVLLLVYGRRPRRMEHGVPQDGGD